MLYVYRSFYAEEPYIYTYIYRSDMYRPLIIGPYELCLDMYFLCIDIIGLYISRNLYASMHIYLCLHIHDDDCF